MMSREQREAQAWQVYGRLVEPAPGQYALRREYKATLQLFTGFYAQNQY